MFSQVVVGPPGSGKTTYCRGLCELFEGIKRPFSIINLDFANENIPYKADIDVRDLITLDDIMEAFKLGPNGALMFGMEFLENNLDWLDDEITRVLQSQPRYLIFDCPGQVELFIHHRSLERIFHHLVKKWDMRFCCVHLVEATFIADPCQYISQLLLSLQTMIHLKMPHVNVLSKSDILSGFSENQLMDSTSGKSDKELQSYKALKIELPFELEEYTEVVHLDKLLVLLNESAFGKRFKSLNEALCDLIEDYSLVSFQTLAVESKSSMMALLKLADKTNGYHDLEDSVHLEQEEKHELEERIRSEFSIKNL